MFVITKGISEIWRTKTKEDAIIHKAGRYSYLQRRMIWWMGLQKHHLKFYMDTFQYGDGYRNVSFLCDSAKSFGSDPTCVHPSCIRENGQVEDFRSSFSGFRSPSNSHILNNNEQHSKHRAEPLHLSCYSTTGI